MKSNKQLSDPKREALETAEACGSIRSDEAAANTIKSLTSSRLGVPPLLKVAVIHYEITPAGRKALLDAEEQDVG